MRVGSRVFIRSSGHTGEVLALEKIQAGSPWEEVHASLKLDDNPFPVSVNTLLLGPEEETPVAVEGENGGPG